MIIFQILRN